MTTIELIERYHKVNQELEGLNRFIALALCRLRKAQQRTRYAQACHNFVIARKALEMERDRLYLEIIFTIS